MNKWDVIFDFTTNEEKRNYEFLEAGEFRIVKKELPEFEGEPVEIVFPYSEKYGGEVVEGEKRVEEEKGMVAFKIGMSQEEAMRIMEERESSKNHDKVVVEEEDAFDMFLGGGAQ